MSDLKDPITDSSAKLSVAKEALTIKAKALFQYKMRRLTLQEFVVAAILMVAGILLRTVHIVFRELYGGEFLTLDYLKGKASCINIYDGVMPLYYWIMKGWTTVVGLDSDLLLRTPSVVFGLLTLGICFLFAQRFMRGAVFTAALLVFCLNPVLAGVANQATPFALMGLLATLSCYFTMVALNKGGTRNWWGMGITAILGFLTHPVFMFLILGQMLFVAFRPRRRPKTLWIASIITIGVILTAMFAFALLGQDQLKVISSNIPALDDTIYCLVAMICGDFNRYWNTEFVRALLYLAVFFTLFISAHYYWQRQEEDNGLPEGVVWIDDTADIVQNWRRLSLATFLRLQWFCFLIPGVAIFTIASFVTGIDLRPELFIICLPAFAILFATGVDYAPGRYTRYALTGFFALTMIVYGINTVADSGYGVERLVNRLNDLSFDSKKDKLLIAFHRPAIAPSFERYGVDKFPFEALPRTQDQTMTDQAISKAVEGTERVFVFYWKDNIKFTNASVASSISLVRQWFEKHHDQFPGAAAWRLSTPEESSLVLYTRNTPPGDDAPQKP